jgi:hypothetical protein
MSIDRSSINWRSRVPLAVVVALASASIAIAAPGGHHAHGHSDDAHVTAKGDMTAKHEAFHDDMRKLWEDHITWTRLFIVSAVADLPDLEATTARLLRNQRHIGNAIKPYYGKAAGKQLTKLLTEHILVAADLLGAAKAGDDDAVARHSDRWYQNGNEIGDFLHSANPDNWHRGEMRAMMREHLDLTLEEAVANLTNDHRTDIRAYNQIHKQILPMADMLSDGIAAQFPNRFR